MAERVCKRFRFDEFSMFKKGFTGFTNLVSSKTSNNKAFPNFEPRVNASVTRSNSNGSAVAISETLTAWSIAQNANIDSSQ